MKFAIGLARAFGGAIIFSLPLLMTMKMWYLGSGISEIRLALFLDYLPPHSKRRGGLFFTRDPRQFELQARAFGYEEP